ncbi:uncharacterized protein EI97DRAFT_189000 [Westerdykella ornata]|uniref:Uncharacterized protein n=1 Tax=Westerdykella ornata TaxID=318751 RepID=A0A6A6JA04_WESOR|nr:uncharacterized protein EI97DRAFT_189000 [Westerdykella ornata]KAF2273087.1 hypothetical protein EI97DRAFT_189000 [Westerdykella ornata]
MYNTLWSQRYLRHALWVLHSVGVFNSSSSFSSLIRRRRYSADTAIRRCLPGNKASHLHPVGVQVYGITAFLARRPGAEALAHARIIAALEFDGRGRPAAYIREGRVHAISRFPPYLSFFLISGCGWVRALVYGFRSFHFYGSFWVSCYRWVAIKTVPDGFSILGPCIGQGKCAGGRSGLLFSRNEPFFVTWNLYDGARHQPRPLSLRLDFPRVDSAIVGYAMHVGSMEDDR